MFRSKRVAALTLIVLIAFVSIADAQWQIIKVASEVAPELGKASGVIKVAPKASGVIGILVNPGIVSNPIVNERNAFGLSNNSFTNSLGKTKSDSPFEQISASKPTYEFLARNIETPPEPGVETKPDPLLEEWRGYQATWIQTAETGLRTLNLYNDAELISAVKTFQEQHQIPVDGKLNKGLLTKIERERIRYEISARIDYVARAAAAKAVNF